MKFTEADWKDFERDYLTEANSHYSIGTRKVDQKWIDSLTEQSVSKLFKQFAESRIKVSGKTKVTNESLIESWLTGVMDGDEFPQQPGASRSGRSQGLT